jgi:hypothetical protein
MAAVVDAVSLLGAALVDGRVLAGIAAAMVLEVAWLARRAWRDRAQRRIALGAIAGVLAGICLVLGMREALLLARPDAIGAWLLAALVAHLADLRLRMTPGGTPPHDTARRQ